MAFDPRNTLYGKPRVGGDTLSYCTKCKLELAHIVASMVDGRPVNVVCKTCKGHHKYRMAPGSTAARTSSSSSAKKRTVSTPKSATRVADLWEKKLAEKNADGAVSYRTDQKFVVGDVLIHPNYGIGIVQELRSVTKISVLFRDAERVLIHAIEKAAPAAAQ